MCAGVGSPGTLREVLRGYTGDRSAAQIFDDEEWVEAFPLPRFRGALFRQQEQFAGVIADRGDLRLELIVSNPGAKLIEELWSQRKPAPPGETSCLLYTSPSPRDQRGSRMPSSA